MVQYGKIITLPLWNNHNSVTEEQLQRCHCGTIVVVQFGKKKIKKKKNFWKNRNIVTVERLQESHCGTIVTVSLRSNRDSVTVGNRNGPIVEKS